MHSPKAVSLLDGSYVLGMLDSEDEDTIYVAKNKSLYLLVLVTILMLLLQMH